MNQTRSIIENIVLNERAQFIATRLDECKDIIAQLKSDPNFMGSQIRVSALRHYEDSLDTLKFETELDRGYLACVYDTLELWKREWEDADTTSEQIAKDEKLDDQSADVMIKQMIDIFSAKINSLKNDAEFMADRGRVDRLDYYEKVMQRIDAVKHWADDEDYKQLQRVDVTLGLWVEQWAAEKARRLATENVESGLITPPVSRRGTVIIAEGSE